MRVGLIRQDLSRVYLDDVENTSQRNFSSQPPGQSRYFEYPSNAVLTSVLNQYAFLSILGSAAVYPLTISGANDTLTVKTSSTSSAVSLTLTHAAYSAAALAAYLNTLFATNGLTVVASVQGGQIQIDTVAPSNVTPSFAAIYAGVPQPPIGLSVEYPLVNPINSGPTAYIQLGGNATTGGGTGMGLSTSVIQGLTVAALKGTSSNAGVYQYTTISGQTGTAASVTSVSTNGTAVITGLTGMTTNSTLHYLVISSASSSGNNGTFQIVQYLSATSVVIANPNAVAGDGSNGSIHFAEASVTFNIGYSHIGALSTFTTMEGYSASTPTGAFLNLATAIQNVVAPALIETGPVLLSFANGKLSILLASYFQPGYPAQSNTASPFGLNEGATTRLGYAMGPAVFITANDGSTVFSL